MYLSVSLCQGWAERLNRPILPLESLPAPVFSRTAPAPGPDARDSEGKGERFSVCCRKRQTYTVLNVSSWLVRGWSILDCLWHPSAGAHRAQNVLERISRLPVFLNSSHSLLPHSLLPHPLFLRVLRSAYESTSASGWP